MASLDAGSVIAGKYRLERPLAQGGARSVWAARHLQLDVPVALRFMASELADSAEARLRFDREARAAARLRISSVVQVFDHGIDQGAPYIAMELLHGESLEARLSRVGRLGLAETCEILIQVGKALARAHQMGILHGDLRPENIFITRQGEEEVVKILGFGIASARGLDKIDPATPARSLARAPHYLSPEQVRGGKGEGKRSDLWSLSVIAFRCLTGALPFDRERLGELFGAICSAKAPAPSSLAPGVGPSVDAFFRKALGRAPEERFQSARELCEALALLAGREPETLPPTLPAPPVGAGHRAPEPERTQSHAPAPKQQPVIERIALVLVVLGGVAAFAFAGFTRFHMRAPQPIRSARHLHLVVPRVSLPAPPPTTPPAALEPPPAPVVPAVPKAIPSARLAPRKSPWPSPTRRKNHGPLDDM